jgi:hypothetical protein
MLIFFNDILVYSRSWSEHLQHVHVVLQRLRDRKLVMKCSFSETVVAYLGHIISAQGIVVDAEKVEVL